MDNQVPDPVRRLARTGLRKRAKIMSAKVYIQGRANMLRLVFGILVWVASGVSPAWAALNVSIEPASSLIASGEIFDVTIEVAAGENFNGFDLEVGYDPNFLTYIGRPLSQLPGQLMKDACAGSPFHLFQIAPDSTQLSLTYIMLCSGVSATGPGTVYTLRFQAKNQSGATSLHLLPGTNFYNAGIRVGTLITSDATIVVDYVSAVTETPKPTVYALQAAPNPFNPSTEISFDLPADGPARIVVYDMRGRLIKTLIEGWQTQGPLRAQWNGTDQSGKRQPGGTYLFHVAFSLNGRQLIATRKAVLIP